MLGIGNLMFMKNAVADHAGPIGGGDSKKTLVAEWQNTEVNLNHLDCEADRSRINDLKMVYNKPSVNISSKLM